MHHPRSPVPALEASAESIVKHIAAGETTQVKALIDQVGTDVLDELVPPLGWSALHVAAAAGDVSMVTHLLDNVRSECQLVV